MKRQQILFTLLVFLVVFPWLPGTHRVLGGANQAAVYAVVAASLVLLTGWVGQISLGHAALVGIGSYATGWAAGGLGIPFPLNLPVAVAAAGGVAGLLGVVALRVRGLYLAVATLVFSWAASEFLFRQDWLLKFYRAPARPIGQEGTAPYFDFSGSRLAFYYIAWGIAVAVLYGLSNLRDSKTGRAFFAIRGSEMAAASLGIDVLRYKALAFALSGALAGIAGNLVMTHARVVSPEQFTFNASLFFLAIGVVGGLTSLGGTVGASMLFASLNEVFFRVKALGAYLELVSTGLLAFTFRVYPGGLASLGKAVVRRGGPLAMRMAAVLSRVGKQVGRLFLGRRSTVRTVKRGRGRSSLAARKAGRAPSVNGISSMVSKLARLPGRSARGKIVRAQPLELIASGIDEAISDSESPAVPSSDGRKSQMRLSMKSFEPAVPSFSGDRKERQPLIEARGVTVRFGGLTAVSNASLSVREGEIVGLIGPNGAGKTTLFNAIAGFNTPSTGTIKLYGQEVTGLPVFRRAEVGVARTFQLIQLFPQLSVFDNLLAATHLQNPTGFIGHLAVTRRALEAEERAQEQVRRVVELLDLKDVAFRQVAGLPFGMLRMVEVARALVTGARVIMLDEPASGLDTRETDKLMEVLRYIRNLGATLLVIEHDVRMVTGISDYMYVLDQGKIIAEGAPEAIQRDLAVVAAYLGQSKVSAEVS